ncbi:MAG: copper resistance CopC/CopD family protein [Geminicoccaceae bacterium]
MRPGPMMRAALAAVWLAAIASAPAHGHAVLVGSHPGDGETSTDPPAVIELEFSEPVRPIAVRLLDREGRELTGMAVEAHDELVTVRPRDPLPPGGYFLSYRVTSMDAHPVGATLRFGVGEPAPGAVAEGDVSRSTGYLAAVGRWLFYVTALAAMGAALFAWLVGPPEVLAGRIRRLAAALASAAIMAVLLRLGLSGLDLAGLPIGTLVTPEPWMVAAGTSLGLASVVALAGLAVLALGPRSGQFLMLGVGLVVCSHALTGHVASAPPRWLAGPTVLLHVLGAAFWIGAFVPLLLCLRNGPAELATHLRRFSGLASFAVGGLLLTGATLAWIQLGGRPFALLETDYGWRLLLKLALVLALLAVALVNRVVLTPAIAAGRAGGARWLGRTLTADIVLALAVLAVTATFPLSPPPRSVAVVEPEATIVAPGRGGQATITLRPGRSGANRLEAMVVDRDGLPIMARSAELLWSLPEAGFEPLRLAGSLPQPGVVLAAPVDMPATGRWRVRLDLLVDDFTKLSFEGEIDLR